MALDSVSEASVFFMSMSGVSASELKIKILSCPADLDFGDEGVDILV